MDSPENVLTSNAQPSVPAKSAADLFSEMHATVTRLIAMPPFVTEYRAHPDFVHFWLDVRRLPRLPDLEHTGPFGIRLIKDEDLPIGFIRIVWSNGKSERKVYR